MDKTTLINTSLQVLATTAIFAGITVITQFKPDYVGGIILILGGIGIYYMYEKYPDSPK